MCIVTMFNESDREYTFAARSTKQVSESTLTKTISDGEGNLHVSNDNSSGLGNSDETRTAAIAELNDCKINTEISPDLRSTVLKDSVPCDSESYTRKSHSQIINPASMSQMENIDHLI